MTDEERTLVRSVLLAEVARIRNANAKRVERGMPATGDQLLALRRADILLDVAARTFGE